MNLKIPALILTLAAVVLTACEDIVEVKLREEDQGLFAVEAKITTHGFPEVFLYKSQLVYSGEPYEGVSGAIVTVTENSQPPRSVVLTENPEKPGFYTTNMSSRFWGRPDRVYSVSIETEGQIMTATDTLALVAPLDSIQVRPSLRGDKLFLGIFTYGFEPPARGNYYKWDIYVNGRFMNRTDDIAIASDEWINGRYLAGLEIFTDFHDPDKQEDRKLNPGDTIQVWQYSISEFVYDYYLQMLNQSQTGGFFSVPPANVKSNFIHSENREVLGLFSASDVSVSQKVIITEEIENQLKKK